jgi:hypothetical protein
LCRTFERAGLDPAPILIGPADVDRFRFELDR